MSIKNRSVATVLLLSGLTLGACPLAAQSAPPAPPMQPVSTGPSFADLVDLVESSPVIVDATIATTARIKGAEAIGVRPGDVRQYVQADILALVQGAGGLPARIGYLVDLPLDARGRPPKLKRLRVLLFARRVAGRPDQLQLSAPDAQLDWNPAVDTRVRAIAKAIVATEAPPRITGIGNAFHVPGALPGEGETQVFLQTADDRPVSLSVLRRPGEQPRWAVALSEIVDDSAAPPMPDSLLWYRLACGLPPSLPDRSTESTNPADAELARRDYQFVRDQLGPCTRTRG